MKYLQLLSLEITHEYYANQRCNDFQMVPAPATQALLRNCRCILKFFPNRMRILTPVSDQGIPFIALSEDLSLRFELRLQNPDFALFTDMTAISAAEFPLYTNNGVEPNLHLFSRPEKITESLVVSRPAEKEQFILSRNPHPALQPGDFDLEGLGAVSHPESFDATAKIITMNSKSAAPGSQFTVTYTSAPPLKRNVFAKVEISFENPLMRKMDTDKNFRVVFAANKARWKYYVVIENNTFSPTIEDKDKVVIFNDRTDLSKVPDPSDEIAKKLIEQFPNRRHFRFVSDSFIPCRQTARKAIQLQLNGEKVVDALPNPSLQNYIVDLRNSKQELSLYHIVQYFAR
jgi:hypothetical protein